MKWSMSYCCAIIKDNEMFFSTSAFEMQEQIGGIKKGGSNHLSLRITTETVGAQSSYFPRDLLMVLARTEDQPKMQEL